MWCGLLQTDFALCNAAAELHVDPSGELLVLLQVYAPAIRATEGSDLLASLIKLGLNPDRLDVKLGLNPDSSAENFALKRSQIKQN